MSDALEFDLGCVKALFLSNFMKLTMRVKRNRRERAEYLKKNEGQNVKRVETI